MNRIFIILICLFISTMAWADTHYVVPPGTPGVTPTPDYTNWATAATSIQWAVDAAAGSDTVLVTNGVYYSTGIVASAAMVKVVKGITVRSVNGAAVTILNGNYPAYLNKVFFIDNVSAVVDGFTITNAWYNDYGGGMWFGNGTLQNCVVSGNTVTNSSSGMGGGIYVEGQGGRTGEVRNCQISGNWSGNQGGGVCLRTGGTLRNCVVRNNTGRYGGGVGGEQGGLVANCVIVSNASLASGGGVNISWCGVTVRNSLISGNRAASGGGGISLSASFLNPTSAPVESCTIVGNTNADANAGGLYVTGNTNFSVTDCIIYSNRATAAAADNISSGVAGYTNYFYYNCVGAALPTNQGNFTNNPQFADFASGNYRLLSTSPCIDAGTTNVSYTNDIDGLAHWDFNRDGTNEPDMGCYEFYWPVPSVSPLYFTNTVLIGSITTNELWVWNSNTGISLTYLVQVSTNATNWLSASTTSGTSTGEHDMILLTNNAAGKTCGVYTGLVSVMPSGTYFGVYTTTQNVSVVLNVEPQPCLVVDPSSFSNAVMEGYNVTSQTIQVWNSSTNSQGGYYDMNYSATSDVFWLQVNTNGTTSGGATSEVYMSYSTNVTGFSPRQAPYTGTVWITATDAEFGLPVSNATQTVSVALTVKTRPVISLSPLSLTQEVRTAGNPTNQSFLIWNGSSKPVVPMSYTLSTNKSWLSLSTVSGTSTGEQDQVGVIFTNMNWFGAGTYTGRISVVAVDAGSDYLPVGAVTSTAQLEVTVHLMALAGLSASDGTHTNKVRLTWNAEGVATGYEIWRNTSSNSGTAVKLDDTVNTDYDDTSAGPGTTYYYWMKVRSDSGTSRFSVCNSGWRAMAPPLGVSASDGDTDKVRVTWMASTGATGYEVWRAGNAQDDFSKAVLLAETTSTSYDDTSTEAGMMYYYWMKAQGPEYTSHISSSDSGWRSWLPKTPESVLATDGTYTDKVRVTWSVATNATSYLVYRNTANDNASATALGSTTGTTYDDTTAVAVTTYYYWVKSENDWGNISSFSTPDTGWRASEPDPEPEPPQPPDEPAPGVPAWISATDGAFADKVRVTWAFATNATSYEVWRNTTNNTSSATLKGTTTAAGYDDTTVVLGSTYYFWVKAKNAQGKSGFSSGDSGFSALRPPADLGATDFCMLPEVMRVRASPGLVSVRVYNNGPNPMSETNAWATLEVYLSENETLGDADDIGIGSVSVYMPMSAGQTTDVQLTSSELAQLRIPSTVATGFYSVFLRVEHATFSDPDETNNVVERDGQIEVTSPQGMVRNDFDGDRKTDLAVYHEASGYWFILLSSTYSLSYSKFGEPGYEPVPGDFDGDGKTDLAVYHEASGYWFILFSSSSTLTYLKFGETGYMPVSGDFDGNWKTDVVVYHEVSGYWYILLSGSGTLSYQKFGDIGYEPVPGDFDGDGTSDLAVYQETSGSWFILLSSSSTLTYQKFGEFGYTPVSGDFDGDGKTDLAVYHEASGYWFIQLSGSGSLSYQKLGEPGYAPVPGDFDGDGITDLAVYHESFGYWFILSSSSGALSYLKFGETGYSPVW